MEAKHKARQQEEVKTPDAGALSSESDSKGSDSDDGAADDEAALQEQQAMQAVVNDNLPSFGGDGPDEASGNSAEWAKLNPAEALSAAGPCQVLPERAKASTHGGPADVCGEVNPKGYDWAGRSVVPLMHARALPELWRKWCGQDVFTADDLRGTGEAILHRSRLARKRLWTHGRHSRGTSLLAGAGMRAQVRCGCS